MGRITTYTGIGQIQGKTALEDDDVLLLDGTNGSRKITAKELANAMMDKGSKSREALPVGRSGLYRGATALPISTIGKELAILILTRII